MTYKQFLAELKEFRGTFYVDTDREIRRKDKIAHQGYCPLAAVNVKLGGQNTCEGDKTGLPQSVIEKVIRAADGGKGQIRKDLLRVLGLKEVR